MYISLLLSYACIVISDLILNTTIEERVSLLEIQVVVIQEDMSEVDERVELIEGDVDFLFDEQVIQDERLLNMEQTMIGILGDLDSEYVVK